MAPPTITVDTAALDGAGDATVTAGSAFSRAVEAALGTLGGTGGMTGTDPAGLVVGHRYDDAASAEVVSTVDTVNGVSRIGDLLKMSAFNYATANHYSAIKPGGGPPAKPASTKAFSSHVPPPGGGSLTDAPFGWGIIESIIGMVWPNGDPAKMRAASGAWTALSNAAATFDGALVGPEVQAKGQEIPEKGSITTAFSDASGAVTGLGNAASAIGRQLNSYAQHVDDAHHHLLELISDALQLASPVGLLQEGFSILTGDEGRLQQIAEDARKVLEDLKTQADAVGTLLEPVVKAAEAAGKAMAQWASAELQEAAGVAQVAVAETVNAAATLGNTALHNPLDALAMVGGAAMMAQGATLFGGGVIADATGVGAIVGVPANVVGAAEVAAGTVLAGGGAIDLAREYDQNGVTVMHAHTGRPGEGVDRGDGRDPYGHITGRNGGSYGKGREAEGVAKYEKQNPGRWVTSEQRKASVEGVGNGRFYDGLARKPDGTYEGIEVKSGGASLTADQKAFDKAVSYDNPGHVTITNDQGVVETVKLTSVRRVDMPAE